MATKGRQLLFSVLWTLSVLVNGVNSDHDTISHSEDLSMDFTVEFTSSPEPTVSEPASTESPDPTLSTMMVSFSVDVSSSALPPSPSAQSFSTSIDVTVPSTSMPASDSSSTPVVSSPTSASSTAPPPPSSSLIMQPSITPVPGSTGIGLGGIVGIAVAAAVALLLIIVAVVVALAVCHFTVNRKGHYATKEDDIRETSLLRHNASLRSMKNNTPKQETEYYL